MSKRDTPKNQVEMSLQSHGSERERGCLAAEVCRGPAPRRSDRTLRRLEFHAPVAIDEAAGPTAAAAVGEVELEDLNLLFESLAERLQQLDGRVPRAPSALLDCAEALQSLRATVMTELTRREARLAALDVELAQWQSAAS